MGRTLWSMQGEPVGLPLDAWVSSGQPDEVVLEECRRPDYRDLPDLANEVAGLVEDAIDSGLGTFDRIFDRARFAAEMRRPLRWALALCVDLTRADWVPTGRTMTVGEARRERRCGR